MIAAQQVKSSTLVKVDQIVPSAENPRFSLPEVEALAVSMRHYGMIQPLAVRKAGDAYLLLDGHRRLAAAQALGWAEVPTHVVESSATATTMHLIGNVAKEGLTPVETAIAIGKALKGGLKAKDLAAAVSRSAAWVSKFKTIAKALPKEVEKIPEHLLKITDADKLYAWATKGEKLNTVKPTEAELADIEEREATLTKLSQLVGDRFGLPLDAVRIEDGKSGGFKVTLHFLKNETLEKFAAGE